tara:strand:+ start:1252 stop:1614 length:363 start_codon:yes stop_codon:yes gene_type:complete
MFNKVYGGIIVMEGITLGLLGGILALQFVVYFMNQLALRELREKQQSTIYGVSHVWGSIKELRDEMRLNLGSPLPLPPLDGFPFIGQDNNEDIGEAIKEIQDLGYAVVNDLEPNEIKDTV